MQALNDLFGRNGISKQIVEQHFYQEILQGVFQLCCDILSDNQRALTFKSRLRSVNRSMEHLVYAQLIKEATPLQLDEDEIDSIAILIRAFLNRDEQRVKIPDKEKENILARQHHRCAYCGKAIKTIHDDCHIDHIIPFKYTGDELPDNYQALCESCNKEKSTKSFILAELISQGKLTSLREPSEKD